MSSNVTHLLPGSFPADLLRTGFHVESEASAEGVVVRLQGDLDMATATELRRSLVAVLADAPAKLTVDLAQLEFIDSTGIGALVGCYRRAQDQGCAFSLRSPIRPVAKALHLTGVDQLMPIEPAAG